MSFSMHARNGVKSGLNVLATHTWTDLQHGWLVSRKADWSALVYCIEKSQLRLDPSEEARLEHARR